MLYQNYSIFNNPNDDMVTIFWQLLSVLTLPIHQQIQIIGGLPTKRLSQKPYITNAFLFFTALETYKGSWKDEFDGWWDNENQQAMPFFSKFEQTLFNMNESDCYSQTEFLNKNWQTLRQLAKEILAIENLPAIKFPENETIDFNRLVRVFIDENGHILVD